MQDNKQALINYLSDFITPHKKKLIRDTLKYRTNHITICLEDIYQSQNASATIRTCDSMGVQNLHVIENRNTYLQNPDVTLGSSQWITLNRYNKKTKSNTIDCINHLKTKGYHIVATSPHQPGTTMNKIGIRKKLAFLFGTEKKGLSKQALKGADSFLKIPMYGFTESFNISVSVAIVLSQIIHRLHQSKVKWNLTQQEKKSLTLAWYKGIIKNGELVANEFLKNQLH